MTIIAETIRRSRSIENSDADPEEKQRHADLGHFLQLVGSMNQGQGPIANHDPGQKVGGDRRGASASE